MSEKKKICIYAIINVIILYLIYPINQALILLHDFSTNKYIILLYYLLIHLLYIFVNIFIYVLFLKNGTLDSLVKWKYICLGSTLGSVIILLALLVISMKYEFQKYPYIECIIPFDLTNIYALKCFITNIIYIILIYELSEKIYKYKQVRNNKE